jgi:hypothetical protein
MSNVVCATVFYTDNIKLIKFKKKSSFSEKVPELNTFQNFNISGCERANAFETSPPTFCVPCDKRSRKVKQFIIRFYRFTQTEIVKLARLY